MKLRVGLLDYLLLCMNSNRAEDSAKVDSKVAISQMYIEQKAGQIQTKLGVSLDDKMISVNSNYVLFYLKNVASERVATILNSFHHSLRLFVNLYLLEKEITLDSEYVPGFGRSWIVCADPA